MTISTLCRISLVERWQIAEAGNIGLFATRFRISKVEKPEREELSLVRIAYKSLLPPEIEGKYHIRQYRKTCYVPTERASVE